MSEIHQVTQHIRYDPKDFVNLLSVNAFSYADINDTEWLSKDKSTICRFAPNTWAEILNFNLSSSIVLEGYDDWRGLEPFDVSFNNPVVKLAIGAHKENRSVTDIYPIF